MAIKRLSISLCWRTTDVNRLRSLLIIKIKIKIQYSLQISIYNPLMSTVLKTRWWALMSYGERNSNCRLVCYILFWTIVLEKWMNMSLLFQLRIKQKNRLGSLTLGSNQSKTRMIVNLKPQWKQWKTTLLSFPRIDVNWLLTSQRDMALKIFCNYF